VGKLVGARDYQKIGSDCMRCGEAGSEPRIVLGTQSGER
jgi:hypothetical protein